MKKIIHLLENMLNFENRNEAKNDSAKNELLDTRLEIAPEDSNAKRKINNKLLLLMYSKENEAFFI